MKLHYAICAVAVFGTLMTEGRAAIISATGGLNTADPRIIAAPASLLDSTVTNTRQQGFDERQAVELPTNVTVDVGFIPMGTLVDSHMIFLNTAGGGITDNGVTWTFSGPILGVMSDKPGNLEASSTTLLGAPSTDYPPAGNFLPLGFPNRGMEGNDSYTMLGNQLTVNMRVTQPGDWIRVITATNPEPSTIGIWSVLGLCATLGRWRRRERGVSLTAPG